MPPVAGPVRWAIRLSDDRSHVLAFDGERWDWLPDESVGDVVISTTARRWSTLLFSIQAGKPNPRGQFELTGDPKRIAEFRQLARIE